MKFLIFLVLSVSQMVAAGITYQEGEKQYTVLVCEGMSHTHELIQVEISARIAKGQQIQYVQTSNLHNATVLVNHQEIFKSHYAIEQNLGYTVSSTFALRRYDSQRWHLYVDQRTGYGPLVAPYDLLINCR